MVRYLYEAGLDGAAAATHLEKRLPVDLPAEGEWRNLAVELDGRYLGEVGLCLVSAEHRQCEVGYVPPEAAGAATRPRRRPRWSRWRSMSSVPIG